MYKLKNNGYNFLSLIFFVFILLIVFNAGYIFNKIRPNMSFGELTIKTQEVFKKDNFEHEESVFILDQGLLKINGDEIIYYDDQYQPKWFKHIKGEALGVYNNGHYIYVIDKVVGDIFKINYNGKVLSRIFSQGRIKQVINYNDAELVVLTTNHRLIRYNENLENIRQKSLELDHVLNVTRFNNQYYVLNLEHKNKTYFTRLVTLDQGFEFLSNLNINEGIFYEMAFKGENRLIISNQRLLLMNELDEILWSLTLDFPVYQVLYEDLIYVYMAGTKEEISYHTIQVYDDNGVKIEEIPAPIQDINQMIRHNGRLFLTNDQNICILNDSLDVIFMKEMDEDIKHLEILDETRIILNMEENFGIYTIQ